MRYPRPDNLGRLDQGTRKGLCATVRHAQALGPVRGSPLPTVGLADYGAREGRPLGQRPAQSGCALAGLSPRVRCRAAKNPLLDIRSERPVFHPRTCVGLVTLSLSRRPGEGEGCWDRSPSLATSREKPSTRYTVREPCFARSVLAKTLCSSSRASLSDYRLSVPQSL